MFSQEYSIRRHKLEKNGSDPNVQKKKVDPRIAIVGLWDPCESAAMRMDVERADESKIGRIAFTSNTPRALELAEELPEARLIVLCNTNGGARDLIEPLRHSCPNATIIIHCNDDRGKRKVDGFVGIMNSDTIVRLLTWEGLPWADKVALKEAFPRIEWQS